MHRQIADGIEYRELGARHFWVAITAVCSRGPAQVTGGFLAAVYDPTAAAGVMSAIVDRTPTKSAVHAYGPYAIASATTLQDRREAVVADIRAEQGRIEAFRRDLAIGSDTDCGMVIQVRGPMIEIGVPPATLTPNG